MSKNVADVRLFHILHYTAFIENKFWNLVLEVWSESTVEFGQT